MNEAAVLLYSQLPPLALLAWASLLARAAGRKLSSGKGGSYSYRPLVLAAATSGGASYVVSYVCSFQ